MIKGSVQKENVTIINIYAPNIGAPQYIRQMLTVIKDENDRNTKTTPIYMHCLQETHFRPKDTYRLTVRGWKNIFHANGKQKKAGVAIFISDKIDLKIKRIQEIKKNTA